MTVMAKQVTKLPKKKFDIHDTISNLKSDMGLIAQDFKEKEKSSADKPLDWIIMPEAFQNVVKLNIPIGYCTMFRGWSNTGKSTCVNAVIAGCMRQGILPIIYDTENNFDFSYAIACGMKAEPIYADCEEEVIDEETGEVVGTRMVNKIVDYHGDFLYFNSSRLAMKYGNMDYSQGKEVSKKRDVAVIEDIAYSINEFLDLQNEGKLPMPICFIWDSVGSISCYKSYASKVDNSMWNAKAVSDAFQIALDNRIPCSRKYSSEYTNTFVCVNKIWSDNINAMGSAPSVENKCGKSMGYRCRLIIHFGGKTKASVKKLTAIAKGEKYDYGTVTKVTVDKNQLPSPFNVTYEGEFACVHNGIIGSDTESVDNYKKQYSKYLVEKLEDVSKGKLKIDNSDLTFTEEEVMVNT